MSAAPIRSHARRTHGGVGSWRERRSGSAGLRAELRPHRDRRAHRDGFNRVAWIMPFLALVLGLLTTIFDRAGLEEKARARGSGRRLAGSGVELEHFRTQARKETEL